MYYAGLPANGTQSITSPGADKPSIFMPPPYGPAPAGYPPSQPLAALAPHYATAPQAFAVVTNGSPTGFTSISPAYHSLPYSSLQGIPTSTHAYISAAQYPGISYQTALSPRSAAPSAYPAPVQAGAPLIAAGYPAMTSNIPATTARSYAIGAVPAFHPGYTLPASYHGAGNYGPPF